MQFVTLKCPKCGHLQEERPDCVRCGIIFSKYYALYPPDSGGHQEGQDAMLSSYQAAPEALAGELSEVRQTLRDVMRRLNEVEFERAERSLLRGDFKTLEQRLQGLFDELKARMQALEHREADVNPEQKRDDLLEKSLAETAEHLERTDGRIGELAAQLRDQGTRFGGHAHAVAERLRHLEEKSERTAGHVAQVEDLKRSLVSFKDQVDSVRQETESLRSRPADGTITSIEALEAEFTALRVEVQEALQSHAGRAASGAGELLELRTQVQALQRAVDGVISAPQAPPQDLTQDFRAIIDGLDQVRGFMQILAQKLQP